MTAATGTPAPLAPTEEFLAAAAAHGIAFDDGDLARLGRYLALLFDANTRFNLTSVTDPAQAWMRHIFDSLTLLPTLASTDVNSDDGGGGRIASGAPLRIIDVGAGGGLPGIPLAICMPSAQVTLLETTGKKAAFLRETSAVLGLANVEVVNDRAETAGQDHHRFRERFDVVVARAVGPLSVLLELTVPFARVGGIVLAIKGEKAAEEIAAAKQALHLIHAHVIEARRTPTGTIVVIEKQRKTPRVYPRTPGEPKRKPLG